MSTDLTALNAQIDRADDQRRDATNAYTNLIHQRLIALLGAALPEGGALVTETYSEIGESDVSALRIERLDGTVVTDEDGDDSPSAVLGEEAWEPILSDLRTLLWYAQGIFWRKGEETFEWDALTD